MKIITHGKCLRFTCPECQCIFQAVKHEKCVEYRDYGYDLQPMTGFYAACPECGADVRGDPAWKKGDA